MTAEPQVRECAWCKSTMIYVAKAGRPRKFCSEQCSKSAATARQREKRDSITSLRYHHEFVCPKCSSPLKIINDRRIAWDRASIVECMDPSCTGEFLVRIIIHTTRVGAA